MVPFRQQSKTGPKKSYHMGCKDFCNRGREETASHSSITNFLNGLNFAVLSCRLLKKPPGNINVLHIFAISSSSRHEKRFQILYRLFVILLHIKNIPSCPTKHGLHNVCEHRIFELGGFQLWIQ